MKIQIKSFRIKTMNKKFNLILIKMKHEIELNQNNFSNKLIFQQKMIKRVNRKLIMNKLNKNN